MPLIPFPPWQQCVWCASAAKSDWQQFYVYLSQQLLRWWPGIKELSEMDGTHNSTLQGQGGGGWGQKPTSKKTPRLSPAHPQPFKQGFVPELPSFNKLPITTNWVHWEYWKTSSGMQYRTPNLIRQWPPGGQLVSHNKHREKAKLSIIERTSKTLCSVYASLTLRLQAYTAVQIIFTVINGPLSRLPLINLFL